MAPQVLSFLSCIATDTGMASSVLMGALFLSSMVVFAFPDDVRAEHAGTTRHYSFDVSTSSLPTWNLDV